MRGENEQQAGMYSYISPEQRVPGDHPLRPMRKMTDEIFQQLSQRFDKLYSRVGRPSIAPERLLRALLLQVLYSVRSERMLCNRHPRTTVGGARMYADTEKYSRKKALTVSRGRG